jgi:hypothetical protein
MSTLDHMHQETRQLRADVDAMIEAAKLALEAMRELEKARRAQDARITALEDFVKEHVHSALGDDILEPPSTNPFGPFGCPAAPG